MPFTNMTFDPAICGWDRPGIDTVYHGNLRIYRKNSIGDFLWCRAATPQEVLWIAQYEQMLNLIGLVQQLLINLRER